MSDDFSPEKAATSPGPCPKCGADADVLSVRSKTDRNWWDEWRGCLACVEPLGFASQIMDRHGDYTLILPGGPKPRERRKKPSTTP